jgi:hypothetical protein
MSSFVFRRRKPEKQNKKPKLRGLCDVCCQAGALFVIYAALCVTSAGAQMPENDLTYQAKAQSSD